MQVDRPTPPTCPVTRLHVQVTSATRDEGNFADRQQIGSFGKLRLSTLRELASFATTSELAGTDVLPYPTMRN